MRVLSLLFYFAYIFSKNLFYYFTTSLEGDYGGEQEEEEDAERGMKCQIHLLKFPWEISKIYFEDENEDETIVARKNQNVNFNGYCTKNEVFH